MTEGSVKPEDSSFKKNQSEEQEKSNLSNIKALFQKKRRERAEEIMAKSFSYLLKKQIYKLEKLS